MGTAWRPIRLSRAFATGCDQVKVPPKAVMSLPLPKGAKPPLADGAACSWLNRYSGWPHQVTCLSPPGRTISLMPDAGTPRAPGESLVSTAGQARAQAGIAPHVVVVPYHWSSLKVYTGKSIHPAPVRNGSASTLLPPIFVW